MIQTVEKVAQKMPIVQKLEGDFGFDGVTMSFGDIQIPSRWRSTLYQRTRNSRTTNEGVKTKNLYLRGKLDSREVSWFGLVTDKFQEIRASSIENVLRKKTRSVPIVRYAKHAERFILNSKVGEIEDKELYLSIDSGDFGTYGGNGQMAVRAGLATYNQKTNSWASFHSHTIAQTRIIHRIDTPSLENVIDTILESVDSIKRRVSVSSDVRYGSRVLSDMIMYLGSRTASQRVLTLVGEDINSSSITAASLAQRISLQAQKLPDRAQLRLENVAGEILYHAGSIEERYVSSRQPIQLTLKF